MLGFCEPSNCRKPGAALEKPSVLVPVDAFALAGGSIADGKADSAGRLEMGAEWAGAA